MPIYSTSRMIRRVAIALLGCGILAMLDPAVVVAQGARYEPARPTVSPYAGLLQTNLGPIPNYHLLVRPRQQQRAFNQQLQATTQTQSLQIQALSSGAAQQPTAVQTGKGAGFMQYLHYYQPMQPVNRR
jgi:hypothetical protein